MRNEKFIKIYEATRQDHFPVLVGCCFNVEQYADLASLIYQRMYYYLEEKNKKMVKRYIKWAANHISCRREKRFYEDFLYEI